MSTESECLAARQRYWKRREAVLAQKRDYLQKNREQINQRRKLAREQNPERFRQQRRQDYLKHREKRKQNAEKYYLKLRGSSDPHDIEIRQRILDNMMRYYWQNHEAINQKTRAQRYSLRSLDYDKLEFIAQQKQGTNEQAQEFVELLYQDLTDKQVEFLDTLMDCDFDIDAVANTLYMTATSCNEIMAAIREVAIGIKSATD